MEQLKGDYTNMEQSTVIFILEVLMFLAFLGFAYRGTQAIFITAVIGCFLAGIFIGELLPLTRIVYKLFLISVLFVNIPVEQVSGIYQLDLNNISLNPWVIILFTPTVCYYLIDYLYEKRNIDSTYKVYREMVLYYQNFDINTAMEKYPKISQEEFEKYQIRIEKTLKRLFPKIELDKQYPMEYFKNYKTMYESENKDETK